MHPTLHPVGKCPLSHPADNHDRDCGNEEEEDREDDEDENGEDEKDDKNINAQGITDILANMCQEPE